MFESIKNNPFSAGKGMLLVSEPFLYDSNFKRSVVFLCEHNDKGSFGLILNRKLEIGVKDVLEIETNLEIPLHLGGPVQKNTLHYLHRESRLADSAEPVGDGIYWGGDFEVLQILLRNNDIDPADFRFFLGYSGWGENQLDAEMEIQSWIVAPSSQNVIFEADEDKMWTTILESLGGEYRILSKSPESPHLN